MNPTTYYEDQLGVMVTDRCVTIGDHAYLTAAITSVTTTAVHPKRAGVILAAILASGFVFFGVASTGYKWCVFGAMLFGLCGIAYRRMKTKWHLRIATACGESSPMQSANRKEISTIANAIGNAIAHRA
jgi:hypothetical protein